MKRIASLILSMLVLCMAFALPVMAEEAAAETPAAAYTPGEYTAEAKGYNGMVTATVTIDETGAIAEVKLEGPQETPTLGGYAMQDMSKWILKAQSTDVDAYAGATFTHDAIIAAVDDCLAQASAQ